ncbi:MAG: flavodoxin-dependent (E)-4-hydroxy-3-methylbut-2-enyl-diphosphate synthase, partial [Bacteroidales bacterium]|nr:flavodoxin-dependent (E)-4-hydroxy-3-methylbut-2-enyl-diphosphate synthase [Bacteroidales bacterium]
MNKIANDGYCPSLFRYERQLTSQIEIGGMAMGGDAPIRIQSMTTTDTNDVAGSAEQSVRIIDAGGEIVRLTTQGEREAKSIGEISKELKKRGFRTPLVADVHFNPKAAETAAALVEAVRINPGNYTGEAKRFNKDADKLTDQEWHELIVEKLRPLVGICKTNKTAIRIGVNHGSLSDRVMAKYGDTPEGMVASCTEYLDAFEELGFRDLAISIKSSNTRVMVETVRLLSATLRRRGNVYPLHLGVTEAGSDAEGRIKSAAGIGALLNDGLGDTIRV